MIIKRLPVTFILGLALSGSGAPFSAAAQTAGAGSEWSAGKKAFDRADYAEAERYYREAWSAAEAALAPATHRASILGSLAQIAHEQGRLKEAEELFDRSFGIMKSEPVDPRVRTILLLNFSEFLTETNHLDRAESMLKEAQSLCREYFGQESSQMAGILKAFGITYATKGQLKPAEANLKKALAVGERTLGSRPAELAAILTTLGAVHAMQKKWDSAEQLVLRAIGLLERSFGPGHPGIADALTNLGEQYVRRGKPDRAETVLRRALSIRKDVLGPGNRLVALLSARLAAALTAQMKYGEAQELLVTSLSIQERVSGPKDPDFVSTLEQFANLLRNMKDVAQAETIEARARHIRAELSFTVSADRLGR